MPDFMNVRAVPEVYQYGDAELGARRAAAEAIAAVGTIGAETLADMQAEREASEAAAALAQQSAASIPGEISARKALIDEDPTSSDPRLLIADRFGGVRGGIHPNGDYEVGKIYLGAAGLRTGILDIYSDGDDDDQNVYLTDKRGAARANLTRRTAAVPTPSPTPTPTILEAKPDASWRFNEKVRAGLDASQLIIGDSTTAGVATFSYMQAAELHAAYPQATIIWRYWDNGAIDAYGAPVTLYAGTGPTITIFCAARSGSTLWYQMGSLFDAAAGDSIFPAGTSADWIIVNHGRNHPNQTGPSDISAAGFLGPMMQLMARHPYAGYSLIIQAPYRDTSNYTNMAEAQRRAAQLLGWSTIDIYKLFRDAGKPASWYSDDVHYSATGNQQIVTKLLAPLFSEQISQQVHGRVSLHETIKNPLINGDFSVWAGGLPFAWEAIGATVTEDTAIYESSGRSARLTGSGATLNCLRQTLSGDAVRPFLGRFVSLMNRQYFPVGMSGGAYGPNVTYSLDGGSTWSSDRRGTLIQVANNRPAAQGGFISHSSLTLIPRAGVTHMRVETSGGSMVAGQTMNIDHAVLCCGALPKEMEF